MDIKIILNLLKIPIFIDHWYELKMDEYFLNTNFYRSSLLSHKPETVFYMEHLPKNALNIVNVH